MNFATKEYLSLFLGTRVLSLLDTDYDGNIVPELPAYAWPGGYDIAYYDKDNSCLCSNCANKTIRCNLDSLSDDYTAWCEEESEEEYKPRIVFYGMDVITGCESADCWEENSYCEECGKELGPIDPRDRENETSEETTEEL